MKDIAQGFIVSRQQDSTKYVLKSYPHLDSYIGNSLEDHTVVVLDNNLGAPHVSENGILHVNLYSFRKLIRHLDVFITSRKSGDDFSKCSSRFLRKITEELGD